MRTTKSRLFLTLLVLLFLAIVAGIAFTNYGFKFREMIEKRPVIVKAQSPLTESPKKVSSATISFVILDSISQEKHEDISTARVTFLHRIRNGKIGRIIITTSSPLSIGENIYYPDKFHEALQLNAPYTLHVGYIEGAPWSSFEVGAFCTPVSTMDNCSKRLQGFGSNTYTLRQLQALVETNTSTVEFTIKDIWLWSISPLE